MFVVHTPKITSSLRLQESEQTLLSSSFLALRMKTRLFLPHRLRRMLSLVSPSIYAITFSTKPCPIGAYRTAHLLLQSQACREVSCLHCFETRHTEMGRMTDLFVQMDRKQNQGHAALCSHSFLAIWFHLSSTYQSSDNCSPLRQPDLLWISITTRQVYPAQSQGRECSL